MFVFVCFCFSDKPMIDLKGKAKWDAWDSRKGKKQEKQKERKKERKQVLNAKRGLGVCIMSVL